MRLALQQQWLDLQQRLVRRGELPAVTLSLRVPGTGTLWFGTLADAEPAETSLGQALPDAADHAVIYRARPDVGAIIQGAGSYGPLVASFGGCMPVLFDEQARHLGRMAAAVGDASRLPDALVGGGNVLLLSERPLCLGTTASRAALNAELFEKCAKAYTLAQATGATLTRLPWWVVLIATRRLARDQRHAVLAFASGELPTESRGY